MSMDTMAGTSPSKEKASAGTLQRTSADRSRALMQVMRPYLMIAPAMTAFGCFLLYPIAYMAYLSFFKWNLLSEKKFIGLDNYRSLLTSREFHQALASSIEYMALTVFFSISLGLALALFLRRSTPVNRFLQSVVFAPYVVPLVSVSFIWMWLMDTDFGFLNYLIGLAGFPRIGWLDDPDVALHSLILVAVWKGLGYNALILLSALQAIPGYLYEAARLDHTPPLRSFLRITLPLMSPTLFFITLMNIISSFKVFETISIMTKGGPVNSTNTLVFFIYQYGFEFYKIGYASAAGVVLMLIIAALTVLYFRMLSKRIHYR